MHLLIAALLGAVQGLTEFLPVSSTAHLLIAERVLGFADPGSVFTITIQFGSILAVMWMYRAKIAAVVRGLPSDPSARRFALMVLLAFLPAVVAGKLLEDHIKMLHGHMTIIAVAFIVGGIIMLFVERNRPVPVVHQADQTPVGRAVAIGVCQTVAMIPGVSRSGATIVGGLLVGLDRPAAAEFSFFLAMPTMAAVFAHDLWNVRHELSADRSAEIAVGFVMAFIAAALVVRPFLRFVGRSGFAPFAWYRIVAGVAILAAIGLGDALMIAWLRRSFIAGFFVTVPLVVSVVAIVWVFRFADRLTGGLGEHLFGQPWPGIGIIATALIVLAVGALTTNVFGQRLLHRSEDLLLHVPLFRTVYAPVKQLLSAFSPDNEVGFKRMVLIEDSTKGTVLGFLTKEFTVDRGRGPETFVSVYVPTNHLYLGDIVICPAGRVSYPSLTVEEGIRVFLTGGTGLPEKMRVSTRDNVN